jgi:hypothetical protein
MTSKSKQLENQETEIDYEDMLLKRFRIVESVIFSEDSGSEMCHKTTRKFMQKLRAVVKF